MQILPRSSRYFFEQSEWSEWSGWSCFVWSFHNQDQLTYQNEEKPTSTSLRLSEVKSSSVLPQPARCPIKKVFEENSHLLLFHPTRQSSGQAQEDIQGQRKTGRLVLLKEGMIKFLLKMLYILVFKRAMSWICCVKLKSL